MDFSVISDDKNTPNLCIRVQTQSRHGKKTVNISSPLRIVNELDYKVEVNYSEISFNSEANSHIGSQVVLGELPPDGSLYIPSYVAQLKRLYVRPLTNADNSGLSG